MFPPKMKHVFVGSQSDESVCVHCGYSEKSHGVEATCEVCGTVGDAGFYPDHKHPKKMLICFECYEKHVSAENRAKEELRARQVAQNIETPGQYFVSGSSSIQDIVNSVQSDESIHSNDRAATICSIVKERILNFQKNILELNQAVRENQRQQNEFQIYLNHKMKEISAEAQERLGLTNIQYKPEIKKEKVARSTPSKKLNLEELKRTANEWNIPIDALRLIVVARNVSIDRAASIYMEMNKKLTETKTE